RDPEMSRGLGDVYKRQRYSIGIAMSEEKYSGIVGALRGKYINCLVTNSSTAELLLK
ncbi:sugar-binding domain-containing protein, partial [Escherichia coli]